MNEEPNPVRDPSFPFGLLMVLLVGLVALGLTAPGCGNNEPSVEQRLLQRERERQASQVAAPLTFEDKLKQAEDEFERRNYGTVQSLTDKLLVDHPTDGRVLLLAARAAMAEEGLDRAIELLNVIPDDDTVNAPIALRSASSWLADAGHYDQAVERLARLKAGGHAKRIDLHELASLLNNSGRRIEAAEVLRELIRLGDVTEKELFSLVTLSGPFVDASRPRPAKGNTLPKAALAEARVLREKDADKAIDLTFQLHQTYPQSPQIFAFFARLVAERRDMNHLAVLLKLRPDQIETQPEYWFAMGLMLQERSEHQQAVRCFYEAVLRDPTDRFSLLHMGQSLKVLGRTELAQQMVDRSQLLDETSHIIRKIGGAPGTDAQLTRLADILDELQRPLEAIQWRLINAKQTRAVPEEFEQLKRQRQHWGQRMTSENSQNTLPGIELDQWPLPVSDQLATESAITGADEAMQAKIQMRNVADQAGLKFTFVNRIPPADGPNSIYHLNGGGIGIVDFDLDGWPDCYFSQAGGPPMNANGSLPNELFRNLGGVAFESVSDHSGTSDRGFGQGVAVADLNQDGFPDVLVANIGDNLWYQNQGDGSFVRRAFFDARGENVEVVSWTSSIGCGDLSGDGLPEVVFVNYADDENAYRLPCEAGGEYCNPHQLRAASDQVVSVQADGAFLDCSKGVPTSEHLGHGFGIVVGNIDRERADLTSRNEMLIVNDTDANHYWRSAVGNQSSDAPRVMGESAQLLGLAAGVLGNRQGCMGLAHGDFDRDGRMDFHVTNYWNQPSDIFLQRDGSVFQNATTGYSMASCSTERVGWGTQANDLDRDGWLDLVVLNGHVVDYLDGKTPYEMPPQLFRGGASNFADISSNQGGYWDLPTLGRTLAMLDWNRDGKTDFIANHLDAPVALLENQTSAANWVRFELVGTQSDRDSVGATITVDAGGQSWTGWVVGGHGFQCSNQATVDFGIADSVTVDSVEVHWPSGRVQRVSKLPANDSYLIIEGFAEPYSQDQ